MNWFEWAKEYLANWKAQAANPNLFAEEIGIMLTPRAQQVLALSRKEAGRLNHNFVGTEHLLLGLIKLGQGIAVNVLHKLGLDFNTVRMEVEKLAPHSNGSQDFYNLPYTPRAKRVLRLAEKDAKALHHTYLGTEHILLGLLAEGDGVAGKVFKKFNLNLKQVREEILKELDPNFPSEDDDQKGKR